MIRPILSALCLFVFAAPALAAGRGYLGVGFTTLPASETRVREGALIGTVLAGSAAQRAGLKPGDIVTQIDGVFVGDPKSAVDAVSDHSAGDRLSLTVIDTANGGLRQTHVLVILAATRPRGFATEVEAPARAPTGNGPAAPVALRTLQAGACSAMAPVGWQVTDINNEGSVFTVEGGRMKAAYGITGIGSGQARGFYGPQYRSPASFALYMSGLLFQSQVSADPPRSLDYGFQLLTWRTSNGFSGFTIFKGYPLPFDPGGYVVSLYVGGAPSGEAKQLGPLAMGVATTIRCSTRSRPPPPNDFHPAHGATCVGRACSESDAAASDFNAILGTEHVHDAAGNNYYVGSENWIENGRDGPGYYRRNGNDLIKLEPGLQ